jgi:translocator assembly and maintenance protein 41
MQETRGARIYFNPYVKFNNDSNTLYKYGIISRKHLIKDLLDWETLYIAGRLQVNIFSSTNNFYIYLVFL